MVKSLAQIRLIKKKHCYDTFDSDAIECAWWQELEAMSPAKYLKHTGLTKDEFIAEYGLETYNSTVLRLI